MRARLDALPSDSSPPRRHDLWLKRFLQHGKWKLDKAMELYLEMEAWRRECGADQILDKQPPVEHVNKVLPLDMIGFYPYSTDRIGRQIAWMRVGHVPWWRPLFEPLDEAIQSQLWMGEWLDADVAQRASDTGVWRERAVILVDLASLDWNYFQGLAGSGRSRRRGAMMSVAKYYPGIVDKAYIVNAPGFANKAWSVCKYFLSEALMDKAVMVVSAAEKAAMLEALGAENVPSSLGGTSRTPTMPVPEHIRMPDDGWEGVIEAWRPREITVGARDRHEEVLHVPPGGRLQWQWALTDSSIHFEVLRRDAGGGSEVVSPRQEVTFVADLDDPQQGEVAASTEASEIRLIWDNEASRFKAKSLLLRLTIL